MGVSAGGQLLRATKAREFSGAFERRPHRVLSVLLVSPECAHYCGKPEAECSKSHQPSPPIPLLNPGGEGGDVPASARHVPSPLKPL